MTTIAKVEQAIDDVYSSGAIELIDGSVVTVPFIQDTPWYQSNKVQTFPALTLELLGYHEASGMQESTTYIRVEEDTTVIPHTTKTREAPPWYVLEFQLHSWVADDAMADRQLVELVDTRKLVRDMITVDQENYHLFRSGADSANGKDGDQMIYHRVWSIEVIVDFVPYQRDFVGKQVHEVQFRTGIVQLKAIDQDKAKAQVLTDQQGGRSLYKGRLVPVNTQNEVVTAAKATVTSAGVVGFNESNFWIP